MKKIYLLFVLCLIGTAGRSQTAASYNFSTTTAAFTSISSDPGAILVTGTATGMNDDDGSTTGIPIGFSFNYAGASYTTLEARSNGWLSLSESGPASSDWIPDASKITGPGWLMPFWTDLFGSGDTVYYETAGPVGNQVFTIEYHNWAICCPPGPVTMLNLQVKLFEATGVVQFTYGASSGSMPNTAVIGIANSTSDYQTLPSETATATDLNFNTSSTFPADGTIFQWCPPLATPTVSGNADVCAGNVTMLTANRSGGIWASSDGSVAAVGTAGDVTGVTTGSAVISYTISNDCMSRTAIMNFTVHSLPVLSTGSNTAICYGGSAILSGSGADVYTWTPADNLSCYNCTNPTATPTVTTTYTLTGTQFSYTTAMVYSQAFDSSVNSGPDSVQGMAWGTFLSSLPATGVVGFTMRGTYDTTGISCTDPSTAQAVADALRTGALFSGSSDSHTWNVGGCGGGQELNADQSICQCSGNGYTVRPQIGNYNWGGINTGTCSATSQVMEVVFYVMSGCDNMATVTITVNPLPTVYNVTGGGSYCAGGAGVPVGLDSANTGINYQLYADLATSGTPAAGANAPLSFGLQTTAGTYTVVATDATTLCSSDMAGSVNVSITPLVFPTVSIFRSTSDTICGGTHTLFTTSITDGGSTPHYIWKVNGATAGADSFAYDYAPATGNRVNVLLVSNAACATPDTVSSDTLTMIVLPNGAPSVHLSAAPGDTVCAGTSITITATPTFGGNNPDYTWIKNTTIVSTSSSYTFTPIDGDNVYAVMNSDYMCRTATTAYSNVITEKVVAPVVPSVTITARPGVTLTPGIPDTLTANPVNEGANPSYQWYLGGSALIGATSATYIRTSPNNHDSLSVMVTRKDACGLSTINSVVLHVYPVGVQSLTSGAEIVLVPNPNKGSFNIKGSLGLTADENVVAEITDMLGQSVYKTSFATHNGNVDQPIQLSNALANGVYMLNLHSSAGNNIFRFVIER